MDGQNVDADLSQDIAAIAEPTLEFFSVGLDFFDQKNGAAALDGFLGPLERFQFHAFDVQLDEIDARKLKFVERDFANFGGVFRVIDRLADKLVVARWRSSRLPKLDAII